MLATVVICDLFYEVFSLVLYSRLESSELLVKF